MNPLSPIALSGMMAASQRLAVSAENVANARSTGNLATGGEVSPYQPKKLVATAIEPSGGVSTRVAVKDAVSVPSADGQTIELPDVDVAAEQVEQRFAAYDFKANLKALQVADQMAKSLFDFLA